MRKKRWQHIPEKCDKCKVELTEDDPECPVCYVNYCEDCWSDVKIHDDLRKQVFCPECNPGKYKPEDFKFMLKKYKGVPKRAETLFYALDESDMIRKLWKRLTYPPLERDWNHKLLKSTDQEVADFFKIPLEIEYFYDEEYTVKIPYRTAIKELI